MARSKSTLKIYAEYLPLLGLFRLFGFLPFTLASRIATAVMRVLLFLLPKRRALIHSNLAFSFPQLSQAYRARVARESISNLGRSIAMFARIPRMARQGFHDVIEVEGREHLEKAHRAGQGTLLFSAHFGCWEMMGAYVPTLVDLGAMVVRPLDNLKLNAMVSAVRSSGGGIVIPRKMVLREGLRVLRKNGALGILMDQNFSAGGVFVDWFGRPAATTTIVPLLARRTGAAIIPMHSLWVDQKVRVIFEPPVTLSHHSDINQALAEDTQALTLIIENWIRQNPEQWLWLHNRWKRRPLAGDVIYRRSQDAFQPWVAEPCGTAS